jgi:hypothetical protein
MTLTPYVRKGKSQKAVGDFSDVKVAGVDVTARFGAFQVLPFQPLAAAGASQASASAINQSRVVVSCTLSSQGVRLPTLASAGIGTFIELQIPGTKGVKSYPDAGSQIDAGSTNAALAVVAAKGVNFRRHTATQWITFKSA